MTTLFVVLQPEQQTCPTSIIWLYESWQNVPYFIVSGADLITYELRSHDKGELFPPFLDWSALCKSKLMTFSV